MNEHPSAFAGVEAGRTPEIIKMMHVGVSHRFGSARIWVHKATSVLMTINDYWQKIDDARQASGKLVEMPQRLIDVLCTMDESEIIAYQSHYLDCISQSYDGKLWLGASVLMGGCSDDSFSDFQCWLIAQGRAAFESAIADPDSMAERQRFDGDDGYPMLFHLGSVAVDAFFKRLGIAGRDFAIQERFKALCPPWKYPDLKQPEFLDIDDGDDKVQAIFPKLKARFPMGIKWRD